MSVFTRRCSLGLGILLALAPGSGMAQVDIQLVTLSNESLVDVLPALPVSETSFPVGGKVFVEAWVQTPDPNGLAQVSVDLTYDPALVSVVQIRHTGLFGTLRNGTDNGAGFIDNLSGSNLAGGCIEQAGTAPSWGRALSVQFVANAGGTLTFVAADSNDVSWVVSICGSLTPPTVSYDSATVDICQAVGNPEVCDGIDNNCDGQIDEANPGGGGACISGVPGVCSPGTEFCQGGSLVCVQNVTPTAEVCDGLDNDCDGSIDEGNPGSGASCVTGELGICGPGTRQCVGGAIACVRNLEPTVDNNCNGIDEDCDGTADEHYVAPPTSCGVGVCTGNTGSLICQSGSQADTCDPLAGAAADDTTCDGIDDDCDGANDENYVSLPTSCGIGACASTGNTSCVAGSVADSCNAGAPAADDSVCNGVDDDCDGQTDEEFTPQTTNCGVGACASTGLTSCVGGSVLDSCTPGSPAADDATCDGIDDDCSGVTDEDYVSLSTNCGVGACASTGSTSCVGGTVQDSCTPGTPAADDSACDGIDNDCSGGVDEDYVSISTSCGVGACSATGSTSCVGGAVLDSCTPTAPAANDSVCNGIDDNCDGSTDEDYVSLATTCGVGGCASTGVTSCVGGVVQDSCTPGTPAADDSACDGIDNDCNGGVDEDFVPSGTSCGVGACGSTGSTSCVSGSVLDSCTPGTPAADDSVCNGIDDDCDGSTDEDYVSLTTTCGVGACSGATGVTSCVSGVVLDSCVPLPAGANDTVCNGIDDDCDGATDEDFVPASTSCGVGACASAGVTSCVAGAVQDSCTPGTPAADDSVCNGIDDDCNGVNDEDYVSLPTNCGVGACASTGNTSCVGGIVQDSCTPGTPSIDDSACDGIDNDCNGATDEDYVPVPTSCGVGACVSTGVSSCVGGTVQSNCTPGSPAADDTTCDAVDDDCNGVNDEDYVSLSTNCGVGGCASTGGTSCVGGTVLDSCTPGTPAADDSACDGIDNDCNGGVDEDFASTATSCGVGSCAATGSTSCVGGAVQDNCTPGTPAADDSLCNGIDDDCDGGTDEEFAPATTSCGVGACTGNAGITSCVGGVVLDSCNPVLGASAETCDGVDNDCNGTVDDDPAASATCVTGDPCVANEACSAGVCVSDPCVLDLDSDGIMGDADFAVIAGCFGACYPPTDPCIVTNFDGDAGGCVGTGDFAPFAGCFGKVCAACANCFIPAGRASATVAPQQVMEASVQLVAVREATARDFANTLPASTATFDLRDRFDIEIWASRGEVGEIADAGLAAVFVDLNYDPSVLRVTQIVSSEVFELLSHGMDWADGQVTTVGGVAPLGVGSLGLNAIWVRVANVTVQVVGTGRTRVWTSPSVAAYGISIFNRFGDLDESRIQFGQAGLRLGPNAVTPASKTRGHGKQTREQ